MSADVSTPSLDLTAFRYNPEAAKTMMNLWVGASSVLWAPFWAASSAGIGLWMMREGATKAVPMSDDLPPAFRSWMTVHNLWFKNIAPVAEAVEDATEATIELMTDMPEVALKSADKVVEAAKVQAEAIETSAEKITDTVTEAVKETVAEVPVPEIATPVEAKAADKDVPPVPVPEVAAVAAAAPLLKPTKEAAALAVSKTAVDSMAAPAEAVKKSAPKTAPKSKGSAKKA